jgi:hypothetical protein
MIEQRRATFPEISRHFGSEGESGQQPIKTPSSPPVNAQERKKNRRGSQEGKRDKLEGKGCSFGFSVTSLSPKVNHLTLLDGTHLFKIFFRPGV